MANYEYYVHPFLGQIKRGLVSSETAQTVSEQLLATISHFAAQGWEYYRLDKVDVEVKPGCVAGLLGSGSSFLTFDQLIFRRPARELASTPNAATAAGE